MRYVWRSLKFIDESLREQFPPKAEADPHGMGTEDEFPPEGSREVDRDSREARQEQIVPACKLTECARVIPRHMVSAVTEWGPAENVPQNDVQIPWVRCRQDSEAVLIKHAVDIVKEAAGLI